MVLAGGGTAGVPDGGGQAGASGGTQSGGGRHATGMPHPSNKALIDYRGSPLVAHVLRALRDSAAVGKIVYVGEPDARLDGLYDVQVPGGTRMVDSLALGLGAALGSSEDGPVLLVSSDIPWVTGGTIEQFSLEARALRVGAERAALVYPIVPEAAAKRDFPDQRRTYAKLREGRFTGGNLILLRREAVPALLPQIDRLYRARKNPLALAFLIGLDVLFALLLGRARLPKLEERVSKILGAPVRALPTEAASLAADVDAVEHLAPAAS